MKFIVDKTAIEKAFLPASRVFPIRSIPPTIHASLYLNIIHLDIINLRRTSGRSVGTLKQSNALFRISGSTRQKIPFTFFFQREGLTKRKDLSAETPIFCNAHRLTRPHLLTHLFILVSKGYFTNALFSSAPLCEFVPKLKRCRDIKYSLEH